MNPSGTILEAGDYVVELAFSRVCDPEVLRRALTAMGWSNVIFDETPSPSTGAVPAGAMFGPKGETPRPVMALGRIKPGVTYKPTSKGLAVAPVTRSLGRVTVPSSAPAPKALGRVAAPSPTAPKALGRVTAPGGAAPKALGRVGPRMTDAELADIRSDETKLAASVESAIARKSPAAPGLIKMLAALRASNAAKGIPAPGASKGPLTCENIDTLDQAAWDAMTPADREFYKQCLAAKLGGGSSEDAKAAAYEASCRATGTCAALLPGQRYPGGPIASPGGGGGGPSPGGGGGGPSPGGGGGGGGGGPQEPPPEPMPEPDAAAPAATPPAPTEEAAPATPASAETTSVEDPIQVLIRALKAFEPGAPPTEPLPNETPDIKTLRLQNLWRRWSEWGSPFSTSPGGGAIDDLAMSKVQVSGEGDSDPTRIRFIGHLDARIRLENPPGMQWVFVKPIHLGYDEPIRINVEPHQLNPGAFYEFRVLVRDKTAPTRHEVKRRLGAMGFAPMKLHLLKRNIRLPNRPSSLSMWYGIGQWLHPSTVVTVEDPFYFEQVKEIAP